MQMSDRDLVALMAAILMSGRDEDPPDTYDAVDDAYRILACVEKVQQ
jgi:hypothetical protein